MLILFMNRVLKHSRVILFTLVMLSSWASSYGQSSGYQGKRVIAKIDLLSPLVNRGIDAGIEVAVFRRMSFYLGTSYSNKKYKQFLEDYKFRNGSYPIERSRIRDLQGELILKVFTSRAIPAPKGSYFFLGGGVGTADISGNDFLHNNADPENERYISYLNTGILSNKYKFGFGYQDIIKGFIVLDFDIGVTLGSLSVRGQLEDDCDNCNFLFAGFTNKYGPNIYSFSEWAKNNPGGLGLSAHIRIGFLLF